jgi:hypothetical protein
MFVRGRLSDNWLIEPVRDAIREGAITGMSIRMRVLKDEWGTDEDGGETRDIIEGEVVEAGPVVWPAYTTTSVAVRSLVGALDDDTRAELARELTPTELMDAVGEQLEEAAVAMVEAVEALRDEAEDLGTSAVTTEPATDDGSDEPPVASHETPQERIAKRLEEVRRRRHPIQEL